MVNTRSTCALGVCFIWLFAGVCLAAVEPTEGYLPKFSRRVSRAVRTRTPLRVSFPDVAGVDRMPATFGVPFPRGALSSAENVRVVTASGQEVPCVVRRTATWERRDGDVRWVLIECAVERNTKYFLEFGTQVKRSPVRSSLSVSDTQDGIVVDTGPVRLTFSKRQSFLIASAEMGGRAILPAGRQKRMTLVDEAGEIVLTSDDPKDYRVEVEQAGPLHAIVKVTGWYTRTDGEKLCQYTARVHAYAGEPFVRVVHTFVVAYDTDQVRLKDICVPFVLDAAGAVRAAFGTDTDDPSAQREIASGYLLQDRHDHFVLKRGGKTVAEGRRASGWFDMSSASAGLAIGLRHVWQEYPKELEAAGNEMRVHLWPPHHDKPLDFSARAQLGEERYKAWGNRVYWRNWYKGGLDKHDQALGIAKTNEFILAFHGADSNLAMAQCATLERPLVASAGPEWMCTSDAFGRLRAVDVERFPEIERKMRIGFERFELLRRHIADYGMIHYGDVHYHVLWDEANKRWNPRPWRCWASRFYGFPVMPWIRFARTADPKYLLFGLDNAKHVMDIDMTHVTGKVEGYPYAKRRGGRFGGNGGIIHYAGNVYDIGCDTHLDHLLYAYYLTGYRRAWDMVQEEAGDYLDLERRKASGVLRRYGHRMTGGAMRAFIALYRATWDERYLKLAERMAKFCYENQSPDGTIRHDDVYMVPGMFTYYQATGDPRMRELLLRCMRKLAETAMPMTDPRGYSFYGPAMAYFVTGDPSYLGRSVWWMDRFVECVDDSADPLQRGRTRGHWDYCHLTLHLMYGPYLLEALAQYGKPVEPKGINPLTSGEVLCRRDDREAFTLRARWSCYDGRLSRGKALSRWGEYCKRNKMTARVVIRDANLREVASQDFALDGARGGDVALTVPAGPPGVYRLAVESGHALPMKLLLVGSTLDKCVFPVSDAYVACGDAYYFQVPKGRRQFKLGLKIQAMRTTMRAFVRDPEGRVAATWEKQLGSSPLWKYDTIEWKVPPGQDGKLWSFSVEPRGADAERIYVKLDGPRYLATARSAFFVPPEGLPPGPAPKVADTRLPDMGKTIAIPAGKALLISRGEKKGEGQYANLAAKAGTIEFWLRAQWDADDLRDLTIFSCGPLRLYRRGCIGTYLSLGSGCQSGFVMGPGRWYHVAAVWSGGGSQVRLFIDGVRVGGVVGRAASGLGDWTKPELRLGSAYPMEVDGLRISDVARYRNDFALKPLGAPDEQTLLQLNFEGPLPKFVKVAK